MFKEFYEPGRQTPKKEELSIAEQGKRSAIEALRKGAQDESKPISLRLVRTNALINLLETYAESSENIHAKLDLAEAQVYRDELLREAANDATDKKAA